VKHLILVPDVALGTAGDKFQIALPWAAYLHGIATSLSEAAAADATADAVLALDYQEPGEARAELVTATIARADSVGVLDEGAPSAAKAVAKGTVLTLEVKTAFGGTGTPGKAHVYIIVEHKHEV